MIPVAHDSDSELDHLGWISPATQDAVVPVEARCTAARMPSVVDSCNQDVPRVRHDRTRLTDLLLEMYIERRDVRAWQQSNGAYFPDYGAVTEDDLACHLSGGPRKGGVLTKDGTPMVDKKSGALLTVRRDTMGHYLLSPENKCRVFVFDIDVATAGVWGGERFEARAEFAKPDSPYREGLIGQLLITAECIARRAHRELDIPVAISFSGNKGVHVTGFTGSEAAAHVRSAAHDVLDAIGSFTPLRGSNFFAPENPEMSLSIEVFPKQESIDADKLGNLVRLPLGINRKSNGASCFLRVGGGARSRFQEMDPIEALSGALPWSTP